MQTLFLWDAQGAIDVKLASNMLEDATDDAVVRRAAMDMAQQTWSQRELIDVQVERVAPDWPPRRQPGVDRNLIRLAVWEITSGRTPPKVAIDEAIDVARTYSTEQSPAFVNGVLDAVLKEHQKLTAGLPSPG